MSEIKKNIETCRDEVYAQELAQLRQYWPGIEERRLEYWAEQITNKKCKI